MLEKDLQEEHEPNSESHVHPSMGVSDQRLDLMGLEEVVEDIAFRFWKCHKCLSMSHTIVNCMSKICCRDCFNYGHIAKDCLKKKSTSLQQWVPKWKVSKLLGQDLRNQSAQPIAVVSSPASQPESYPAERNQGKHPALLIASFQNPISPPPTEQPMANFEVDPTPWLSWGHHAIDGGPTRLPRSLYYPAQDPPQRHQAFCIAQVNPPPLPHDEAFWCDQVHDMLLGPLNQNIVEI
jgi:hypothetical protein